MSQIGVKRKSLFSLKDDGVFVATSLKVTLTMVTALTLTVVTAFFSSNVYHDSLTARISMLSAAVDDESIISAKDYKNRGSDGSYLYLRSMLSEVKRVNNDIAFAYIMGMNDVSDVYFIADSADIDDINHAKRGQVFTNAGTSLKQVFYTRGSAVQAPVSDRGGQWVSAVSTIEDEKTGKIIGAIGIDVPISNYISVVAIASTAPLIFGLFVSALFIGIDHIRARRKEALRFRSELVSIASHELRTPFTGIRWGEEILMKSKQTEKNADIISSMYDSTLRLQESIEDILQLANWQAGRYEKLLLAPTDVSRLLDGIVATQILPAAQKNITIEFSHDWPWKLMITCDEQRMKRVFNNLISNSIKYAHPNTKVVVSYEKIDDTHLISITDQGIGIPAAEQKKVFDGFYRASNAAKHQAGGTGMGLYMSRTVIEQHGGKLWLKSQEGKGTTVFVQLPDNLPSN